MIFKRSLAALPRLNGRSAWCDLSFEPDFARKNGNNWRVARHEGGEGGGSLSTRERERIGRSLIARHCTRARTRRIGDVTVQVCVWRKGGWGHVVTSGLTRISPLRVARYTEEFKFFARPRPGLQKLRFPPKIFFPDAPVKRGEGRRNGGGMWGTTTSRRNVGRSAAVGHPGYFPLGGRCAECTPAEEDERGRRTPDAGWNLHRASSRCAALSAAGRGASRERGGGSFHDSLRVISRQVSY